MSGGKGNMYCAESDEAFIRLAAAPDHAGAKKMLEELGIK